MAIVNRFNIKVIAGAGLFAAAIALSPDAAADPLMTGGYACIQGMAGDAPVAAGDPVAAGGPAATGACSAALTDMAGVPFVAPGPVPAAAPVPIGAPVPIPGAPVPIPGAPVPIPGAPVPIPGGPVPIPGAPVPVPAVPAPVIPVGTPLIALGPVLAGAPGDGVVSAPIIGMSGVKDALTIRRQLADRCLVSRFCPVLRPLRPQVRADAGPLPGRTGCEAPHPRTRRRRALRATPASAAIPAQ